ncbi:MAG: PTS sugar transporter subunit IIC, partial [Clostridia bacterium]|nr:PTS sugar transporter subunit IIC [Clostridia bacterium]
MDQKGNKFKNLLKRWFIDAFSGMAMGLFATLLIGLIIKQIGTLIGSDTLLGSTLIVCGQIASSLMGAGIGAGIARALKADKL